MPSVSSLSLLLAAATPSPSPSETATTPAVPSLEDAQESATNAASWVEENWSTWLAIGLRVLLIVVIAAVLRVFVRRAITKLIDRMNRSVPGVEGGTLGGLLVNVERRRQRSQAIGSVLRSVASFLILGTAALMVLATFEINLAPLLASAGVAGVAIGFGARNLVTDFLSGVFMILEDQYGVGDTVDAGVASGEVTSLALDVATTTCELTPCEVTSVACGNGIDDDCNNVFDCADPTCSSQPACVRALGTGGPVTQATDAGPPNP